ncbi:uncharacterized protein LOC121504163 [Cheilinus undulatus]|uniref:uncharacterized protein LOC121504163 n=1 Tax=Cheilinus undulatus TaxID=241271 RepID=UPI001BD45E1D|nr:uncharacterized protein LOC121504163 [Cheilinus undulatus]
MLRRWSHLCFLVLAVSTLSRGKDVPTEPPDNGKQETFTSMTPDSDAADEAKQTVSPSPFLHSNSSGNGTDTTQVDEYTGSVFNNDDFQKNQTTPKAANDSIPAQTTDPVILPEDGGSSGRTEDANLMTTVSKAASTTQSLPVTDKEEPNTSWAYVVLVLIILVIIALCFILYYLRRATRSYSFDLQRPVQPNRLDEPMGTFEPVYLDDLERPEPKEVITDDLSATPVANGTNLQSEEKMSNGENASLSPAPEEKPDENGAETSPITDTSPSPGDEQADNQSTNSINLFFDAVGEEQQNENNNNNPSVCSSDPFVEINLDDPALSDQLLSSPAASSSVLPFSPFSFSSSSS